MAVVSVEHLTKNYGDVAAVRGVDFTINEGEVFALLGPNGAGKTTIVEILEGYRNRTAGGANVLGFDPADNQRNFKERIGIVLQETSVERELSVREAIDTYGRVSIPNASSPTTSSTSSASARRPTPASRRSPAGRSAAWRLPSASSAILISSSSMSRPPDSIRRLAARPGR